MRKRNFKRHSYTLLHATSWNNTGWQDWEISRGYGFIQPNSSVSSYQISESGYALSSEILVRTQETHPSLDSGLESNESYGTTYNPSVVMWQDVPYVTYGQNLTSGFGKDNYRETVCIYDSAFDWGTGVDFPDPDWSEIDAFVAAVDATEIVIELKLAQVLA